MNVFGMLERSARSHFGHEPAIGFGGAQRSFVQLRDRARGVAAGLRAAGVARGDRVAVLMGNRHEWPELLFGLADAGTVCVPVNVLLSGPEIAHVCEDSGVRALVVDELGEARLAELAALPELTVTVGDVEVPEGVRSIAYDELAAGGPGGAAGLEVPAKDDIFIHYYSSGTTGLPKAAVHTHDGVLWNSFGQVHDLALDRDVRYLVVPSLSWAAGFHNLVLGLLWMGGYSALMPTGGVTPDRILHTADAERATHVMLVPTLLREFASDAALLEGLRRTGLRWIVTGAEPVPLALIEQLREELPDVSVCQGYGLSEFPTIATLLRPEETVAHQGSAGRPLSHTDAALLDHEGSIVDAGEGELLLRSPATMRGYHGQPEQTAETLAGGWLHTGDLVSLDDEGFVTIIGRTKDMIISGGLNVYPREVEEVLQAVPGLFETAVVGVADERFGERCVAIVVPDEGTTIDPELIERVCSEQLASYKRPRAILVHDSPLPRNPTGKLLKRELRPWAAAQLDGEDHEGA